MVASALTMLLLYALIELLPGFIQWALFDAVWGEKGHEACRVDGAGACWAIMP